MAKVWELLECRGHSCGWGRVDEETRRKGHASHQPLEDQRIPALSELTARASNREAV